MTRREPPGRGSVATVDPSNLLIMTWNAQMTGGGGAPAASKDDLVKLIHEQIGRHASNTSVVVLNEACSTTVKDAADELKVLTRQDWHVADFQAGSESTATHYVLA